MQVMAQDLREGVGKYLLELPDPLRETLEGVCAYGQVLEALEDLPGSGGAALKNLPGPVMSPCPGCIAGVLTAENILLLSEQNGFLNSMKKSHFLSDSAVSSCEAFVSSGDTLRLHRPQDTKDLNL